MRKGFTTGSCAAAAAYAAADELLNGEISDQVSIQLPGGDYLVIPVQREGKGEYYVVKDSGDDPDVTNHTEIHAGIIEIPESEFLSSADGYKKMFQSDHCPWLYLTGGEGVGIVTKAGLEQKIGYPAINKVPRSMIFSAVESVIDTSDSNIRPGKDKKWVIIVSVPEGERLAKKTFNPQLGIMGGISILGTSGIVEPMSEAALTATIELEIRQTISQGMTDLIFVPGNYGERYVRTKLNLNNRLIQCSNFIGEAVDLAKAYEASSVLLVGNFGKLVKIAGGIMNTHSKAADGRWEIVVSHAALMGAKISTLKKIRNAVTTDEMLHILEREGGEELKQKVTESIIQEAERKILKRAAGMEIGIVFYSEKYGYIGKTSLADNILNRIKMHTEQ